MEYGIVIGLEVHAELKTKSKIFCGCSNEFGGQPNTHVCPICLGMPGVLPVLNKSVLEFAMKAGMAINCEISRYSKFDRKNYFYPDLPKAYQISQFDLPICKDGYIDIDVEGETKRIRVNRIHMEEDAGKLVHTEGYGSSAVDVNRCGVPLIEIVSEADMRSPQEAYEYLTKLKSILEYTEVSDCKMQEGSLRCDANISLRPKGQEEFGIRAELKNMNSFKGVLKGLEYEVKRQTEILESGGEVVQETRRWDDEKGVTSSMRGKEEAHDYRYFPDPDLVPIEVDEEWIQRIKDELPELPDVRKKRLIEEDGLPEYDAGVITASKGLAVFYDECMKGYHNSKVVSNWIMGELSMYLNENNMEIDECKIAPAQLAEMLKLIDNGTISGKIAKTVFAEMFASGKDPEVIIKEKGLVQISDEGELAKIVEEVIANNPKSVEDYHNGKEKAVGFLVGQIMKATRGKANPALVNKLLKEKM